MRPWGCISRDYDNHPPLLSHILILLQLSEEVRNTTLYHSLTPLFVIFGFCERILFWNANSSCPWFQVWKLSYEVCMFFPSNTALLRICLPFGMSPKCPPDMQPLAIILSFWVTSKISQDCLEWPEESRKILEPDLSRKQKFQQELKSIFYPNGGCVLSINISALIRSQKKR
jgi:hypothetical protein